MPTSETFCISFGNWIAVFPLVYTMVALGLFFGSPMLLDWVVKRIRASRLGRKGKVSGRPQVVHARA